MNAVLREIFDTQTVVTGDGGRIPLHSHIPEEECGIIQVWIRGHGRRRLLEIGLAYGVSSLAICDAIEDWEGVDYCIVDKAQSTHWGSIGVRNLERAGFGDRYRLYEEPSEDCLPKLLKEGRRFDFVLIDGGHKYEDVLADAANADGLLIPGGIVVFDDVQMSGVGEVIARVAASGAYRRLAYPPEFAEARAARVRTMMGAPPYRVAGFRKEAAGAASTI